MKMNFSARRARITRRTMLGAAAAAVASPALAEECRLGPPPHEKGPLVFMNYDQVELDAAYNNSTYEPLLGQVGERLGSLSEAARARLGEPQRLAYGPTAIERPSASTTWSTRIWPARCASTPPRLASIRAGTPWLPDPNRTFGQLPDPLRP